MSRKVTTDPGLTHSTSNASKSRSIPFWRRLVELFVFIAATTLLMFVLSAIALVLYTQGTAEPADVVLVIPAGSGEAIANGESVLDIPPVWSFNSEDTLTLDNRDSVEHTFGDLSVAPNDALVIVIDASVEGEYLTTLDPRGVVSVNVEPSGFDFSVIAFPTFGFGIAVGIIVYAGFSIARAMGANEDEDWADA